MGVTEFNHNYYNFLKFDCFFFYELFCNLCIVFVVLCLFVQREFSLFLSVEEYLMPEVRKNIFLRYLGKYLGYKDSKVQGRAGEKVINQQNVTCVSVW